MRSLPNYGGTPTEVLRVDAAKGGFSSDGGQLGLLWEERTDNEVGVWEAESLTEGAGISKGSEGGVLSLV